MTQKDYTVGGRKFRTAAEYARALKEIKIIEELRERTDFSDREALTALLKEIREGKYPFQTMLGEDFKDELREAVKRAPEPQGRNRGKRFFSGGKEPGREKRAGNGSAGKGPTGTRADRENRSGTVEKGPTGTRADRENGSGTVGEGRTGIKADQENRSGTVGEGRTGTRADRENRSRSARERARPPAGAVAMSEEMKARVRTEMRKQEKRRRLIIGLCSVGAFCCLGYFGVYSWYFYRSEQVSEEFSKLKEMPVIAAEVTPPPGPLYTLDGPEEPREVLDEYKNLLNRNKTLIGWVKIDDTNIDYPVVQALDNEYYLKHNLDQEYDKNGTIFLDKDCDILKPSTNYIVYGHHMKSGKMFGKLDLYEDEDYCKEHPYIQFDTIYEKGTYEVMYVFRSRVYSEKDIVFKYYQFIDANSEQEFNSYMSEMESLSLYDTGVTAEYGDQLLTLSTCDYQEKNGRFVVVAKRIKE